MNKAASFLLDTFYLNRSFKLLKETASKWSEDKCPTLGAALAYYTVFSLAPLMLVLLAVFGLIYGGSANAQDKITKQLGYFLDPSTVGVIKDIAANTSQQSKGILATVVGIVVALFGASGIFGQLQDALNTVWSVKAKPGQGIKGFLRARFLSFSMVGGVCFLLLVSLTLSSVVHLFSDPLKKVLPGGDVIPLLLNLALDLVVVTLLFALIFKYLPDAKIAWKDVWIGAGLRTLFFLIGKWALSIYLGSGSAGSAYGAASALITTFVWVYYSAQILLFGAEFTQIYATEYGSHVEPKEHAVKVETKQVVEPVTK